MDNFQFTKHNFQCTILFLFIFPFIFHFSLFTFHFLLYLCTAKTKMKYKAIIFDLDGTLTDTLEDLYLSTNYALCSCGLPERGLDEIRRFVGNGVRKLIERAVPEGTEAILLDKPISREM